MIKNNCIEIIYLQLYKDTHLIFMQAYEALQGIQNYFKIQKRKNLFLKIKVFINRKVKILLKSSSLKWSLYL